MVSLGPVALLVHTNGAANNLVSTTNLFAEDAKVYRAMKTKYDHEVLQRGMERLQEWSKKCIPSFNSNKCKIIHASRNSQLVNYQLKGSRLGKSTQEKDVGMIVADNLKSSAHVSAIAARANSILCIIKRNFSVLPRIILLSPHLSLVPPIWTMAPGMVPLSGT